MKIAIIGLGVVGKGVYDIITNDFTDIVVKYILEKDKDKIKGLEHCLAGSFEEIINDSEIEVIIELIGGKKEAYEFITKALMHKKHVITANKALLSEKFLELTKLAETQGVELLYEASVAGAIILLDPLKKLREINHIDKIEGILNGSTNFILSKIFLEDKTLQEATKEAFDLGYLEKGSDDDMLGLDALRKINILSMISYQTFINEKDILRIPLTSLTSEFISDVKRRGYLIKYLAESNIANQVLSIKIEPVIVAKDSQYASINYSKNIVNIYGKYHLKQSFIGQGAGRYPTASAVIYDLLTIKTGAKNNLQYNRNYEVNHNQDTYCFLIQTKKNIYKSRMLTYHQVTSDKNIICFARIQEDLYEKI